MTLIERCQYETEVINKERPIPGVEFTTETQVDLGGELFTAYVWSLWKYKWKLEMILPKEYPNAPPLLRIFDESGNQVRHPDIGENGFFKAESSMANFEWKRENTLYWLCGMVMAYLRATTIQEYEVPVLYAPGGNVRHQMKISRDEYHYLVNPFGRDYLKSLEPKYKVRFEVMGGKVRARNNDYSLVIKSDVDGIFGPIEAQIREYMSRAIRRPDSQSSSQPRDRQPCQSSSSNGGAKKNAAEERTVLDSMAGLTASGGATEKPSPGIGRGFGRGRGRLRSSNTSPQPGTADLTGRTATGVPAATASGPAPGGPPDPNLDEPIQSRDQMLAQRICRICNDGAVEMLLINCGHPFCVSCAGIMWTRRQCGRCYKPLTNPPMRIYL